MLYRLSRILLLLLIAATLAACHKLSVHSLVPPNMRSGDADKINALPKAKQLLAQATPCCTSFADFSFQTPLPWRPTRFVLGPGSPVANLNNTHTYFLAFSLPRDAKLPYRIGMKSDVNGRWVKSSYLFAPTVVLLDEAFQPIQTKDIELCEYMGWGSDAHGAYGSATVDDPKARYVVVYSSDKQQNGTTYWEQSASSTSTDITDTTGSVVQMQNGGDFTVSHGPDGIIWVGLINSEYAKAVDKGVCSKPTPGNGVLPQIPVLLKGIGL